MAAVSLPTPLSVSQSGITELADLDVFRSAEWGPIGPGHPAFIRILNAPRDKIHLANLAMLATCKQSVVGAMYGFTDRDAAAAVKRLLMDEHIYCQWTFDSSQLRGATEKAMFDELGLMDSNSIAEGKVAAGTSEHGKIIHDKTMVIDGRFTVTGSTNWSLSGEQEQDNQYIVIDDYVIAKNTTHALNLLHEKVRTQMEKAAGR